MGEGHGRARGISDLAHVDQVEDGILQHFRIDIDGVKEIVFEETAEDRIGHIADPGLPGQEARHAVMLDFVPDEIEDVLGDPPGNLVGFGEHRAAILFLAEEDADHLVRVHLDEGFADAVGGPVDRNRHPVGGILGNEDVVDAFELGRLRGDLDDDLFRLSDIGGGVPDGHGGDQMPVLGNGRGLDYRHVDPPQPPSRTWPESRDRWSSLNWISSALIWFRMVRLLM